MNKLFLIIFKHNIIETVLKSIAVQGGQDPSQFRIYTPNSGSNWKKMMFVLNGADVKSPWTNTFTDRAFRCDK